MKDKIAKVLLVGMLVTIPLSANAKNITAVPTAAKIESNQVQEDKLFIGLIKDSKDNLIEVETLFDTENGFTKADSIFIDVSKASFPNGEVNKYPKGYLISINYEDISKSAQSSTIKATKVTSVEANQECTIAGTEENNQQVEENKLYIGKIKSYKDNLVEVETLFDTENGFTKSDSIFIDITDAKFPNGDIKEYPEGYLINVDYNKIDKSTSSSTIKATNVKSVEADKEATTDNSTEKEVKEETKEVSFWSRIVMFFQNLFS